MANVAPAATKSKPPPPLSLYGEQSTHTRLQQESAAEEASSAAAANFQAHHQNAILSPARAMNSPVLAVFRSSTIAPSPATPQSGFTNLSVDTVVDPDSPMRSSPLLSAGLRISTDVRPKAIRRKSRETSSRRDTGEFSLGEPARQMSVPLGRTPSIKNVLASSHGSAGSAASSTFSSPMINAMADVTPLPSPLLSGESPGPWRKLGSRPSSRGTSKQVPENTALVAANGEPIASAIANQIKRKAFVGLGLSAVPSEPSPILDVDVEKERNMEVLHVRNRSLSDYIPDPLVVPRQGLVAVSGSHLPPKLESTPEDDLPPETQLHREPNLAQQRGLRPTYVAKPPTPPSSRTGGESSDSDSSLTAIPPLRVAKHPRFEHFDAHTKHDSKRRRWRKLRDLEQGTFSTVVLATSQLLPTQGSRSTEQTVFGQRMEDLPTPDDSATNGTPSSRSIVAIKICEHGPKGGASEERVEMSLKRELEIMKSVHHPSIVHLKAWSVEPTRAILVLSYCPGGDLFDFASQHGDWISPILLRRMFAELVGAVSYLHSCHIVHRDIKLENVLVNLPIAEIASHPRDYDWTSHPSSLITLTDLGLSRRVTDDEKLTTRCGSEDYAAPEVIMGQPYDGRATDAWSLGVLLYALLENRLPFDPPPPSANGGHQQRSRTSHRIARVEWLWIRFAGEDGDHEGNEQKFAELDLLGAMRVVEGLLKRARSRWTLDRVVADDWVARGVTVDGGIGQLRFRDEDEADEVEEI